MRVAIFEYRCRRCERRFASGAQTGADRAYGVLVNEITGFKPEPMLGMIVPHNCGDEEFGVADLIGYQVKERQ